MLNPVFGITKNPFGKEVSSGEIFSSPSWEMAIKRVELLIKYRGLGIITGEAGTGKSTLIRLATQGFNPKAYRIVYICDTLLSEIDFLRTVAFGLGIEPPFHKGRLIRSIRDTLISDNERERIHPILIIDEVQLLKTILLEQVRILTNFYMDSKDLLTTILIGQPYFLGQLSLKINLPLRQRISYLVRLSPLSHKDSLGYIYHRLKSCGIQHEVFSESGLAAIYQASSGIPREINRIGFTAMSLAACCNQNTVSDDILTQAIEEMELRP